MIRPDIRCFQIETWGNRRHKLDSTSDRGDKGRQQKRELLSFGTMGKSPDIRRRGERE